MIERIAPVRRVSLRAAWDWLDGLRQPDRDEVVVVDAAACGRVTARDVMSPTALPSLDMVVTDGFAVRADDVLGASGYNPIRLSLAGDGSGKAGEVRAVVSGDPVSADFDAILPAESVERADGAIVVTEPVPRGNGLVRRGLVAAAGNPIIAAGTCLSPADLMLLAETGCDGLTVKRRPVVALLSFGAKGVGDSSRATLEQLVTRDGAHLFATSGDVPMERRLREAATAADLIVVVGRSGWGDDDVAEAMILKAGGTLEHHGLALRPCVSCGLGDVGSVPLVLLPGDPLSTWVGYEMLVARLLRRWSGLRSPLAYRDEPAVLARKIASPVGVADWIPVSCAAGKATPLPISKAFATIVLGRADAFVLIAAESEGWAPDDVVTIHRLRD